MKVLLQLTRPGRIVPDPVTGKPVPPDGLEVVIDDAGKLPRYWRRRVRDGDVTESSITAPSAPTFVVDDED